MPVVHLFTVVGDGNVRRNMTNMNIASRVAMGSAKVIDCSAMSDFAQALREVSADTTVCIVQSVTSFLVACEDAGTIFASIDPLLAEFNTQLRSFASSRPTVQVMVAPPMFRPRPVWYQRHLPEVAAQFSAVLSNKCPRNVHLMASSIAQDLCPDGLHLTPVSGLHYIIHLFDDAQRLLDAATAKGL